MTQIEFHFNATDKLAYACRLLRKATSQGARLFVVAEPDFLRQLDVALWSVSPHDFVSHCMASDVAHVLNASAVVMGAHLQAISGVQTAINFSPLVPQGFESFQRLIDVVSDDPSDRAEARVRWKQYTAQGYTLLRHDLNLKAS
jgi:DNA polymerase-3 subunit chi